MKRICFKLALLLGCSVPVIASAQASSIPVPPVHSFVDQYGVDLLSGSISSNEHVLSIGAGDGEMEFDYFPLSYGNNLNGQVTVSGSVYSAVLGSKTYSFSLSGSSYISSSQDGSVLTRNGGSFTLVLSDGTTAQFSNVVGNGQYVPTDLFKITSLRRPAGGTTWFYYKWFRYPLGNSYLNAVRLQGALNNQGFGIKLDYLTSSNSNTDGVLAHITAVNNAVEFCDLTSDGCSLHGQWPTATYSIAPAVNGGQITLTDPLGRSAVYDPQVKPGIGFNIRKLNGISITYNTSSLDGTVTSSSASGGAGASYERSVNGDALKVTVRDNLNNRVVRTSTFSLSKGLLITDVDGAGDVTSYGYDQYGRITDIYTPSNIHRHYTVDGRGNITSLVTYPNPAVGGTPITLTAGYDATCLSLAKCNRPNFFRDGNGNQTDYTYDTNTGQLTQILWPAIAVNGSSMRSEKDIYYAPAYANYYQDGSGQLRQSPSSVTLKTGDAVCAIAQTCLHNSGSTETGFSYSNNNLLLTRFTIGQNGSAPLYAVTQNTYDSLGNVTSITDPNGSTTVMRYDLDRELLGVIGPDPDNSGPLRNRATRYSYDGAGRVSMTERGATAGQSDAAWAGFSTLEREYFSFDAAGRRVRQDWQQPNGTTFAVSQLTYDAAGRLVCSAIRMNMGVAQASSACQASPQGIYGADRITQFGYDAADRLASITSAVGTASQRTELSTVYSPDGLATARTSANGCVTAFKYDGFDRVQQVQYPTVGNCSVSNQNDYEALTFDANGNVTSDRRRDGQVINYTYDARNNLLSDWNGVYSYDNFNRLVVANAYLLPFSFTYDALGRPISEQSPMGTISRSYDANGNVTSLRWPDGFNVGYFRDTTGAVVGIADNSGNWLATYTYDDLGRRQAIGRGSINVNTWYGYDANTRMNSLVHTFPDSSSNESYLFYYNPAGQVTASTSSNPTYDWVAPTGISRSYTPDGQNRYTNVAGIGLGYDSRGNLNSQSPFGFGYDIHNNLNSVVVTNPDNSTTTVSAYFDSTQRLFHVVDGGSGTTTRFLYDRMQIIAEYDSNNNLLRRYVPGPAVDEVVVWIEGGIASADKRWLLADRQGSIVALANGSGSLIAVNTYDEFGIPGSSNQGRFQFNGAPWIRSEGLYHLRNRAYSPTLGRFLQSDPAGYADGLNFYDYAHSDPVNGWDPNGLGGPNCQGSAPCTLQSTTQVTTPPPDAVLAEVVVTAARTKDEPEVIITAPPEQLSTSFMDFHFDFVVNWPGSAPMRKCSGLQKAVIKFSKDLGKFGTTNDNAALASLGVGFGAAAIGAEPVAGGAAVVAGFFGTVGTASNATSALLYGVSSGNWGKALNVAMGAAGARLARIPEHAPNAELKNGLVEQGTGRASDHITPESEDCE